MALRATLSAALVGLVVALAPLSTGCGGPRSALYAPTTVVGETVLVRVKLAYARGDRIVVKAWMKNTTDQAISIDRDGIALRMPDGRLLPRASGRTTRHEPYELAPGEGRDVHVDFRTGSAELELNDVVLVLGGVTVGDELEPRVVGEIALSSEVRLAGTSRAAPSGADAEPEVEEPASDGEGPPAIDEPEEEWEIGGAG